MADAVLITPDDSANTGKKIDETSLTVGANTVLRQRINLASPTVAANFAEIDATLDALRTSLRPFELLGCYSLNGNASYTATTVNGEIFAWRWGDATRLGVLLRVRVQVVCTAFTTAGLVERQLILARAYTASNSGGTAATLTGNSMKRRTSFGTTLLTDARFGGFLTAGTRTLDAAPVASAANWMSAVGTVIGGPPGAPATLFDAIGGADYPIIFAQNEGFLVRLGAAETASTRQTYVSVDWAEASAY